MKKLKKLKKLIEDAQEIGLTDANICHGGETEKSEAEKSEAERYAEIAGIYEYFSGADPNDWLGMGIGVNQSCGHEWVIDISPMYSYCRDCKALLRNGGIMFQNMLVEEQKKGNE